MRGVHSPLRVAWFGPAGTSGAVAGMGGQLLLGLLRSGAQVDFYGAFEVLPESLRLPNIEIVTTPANWEWNRWYSRGKFPAFVSSSIARYRAYTRLVKILVERNRNRKYDVIFQMSQTELFNLKRHVQELPPIVVFPCVHAAGELRWHRRESSYARESENSILHFLIRFYLVVRTALQKRELQIPDMIIGMSERFSELTREDYGVEPFRQAVIHNPIELPLNNPVRPPEACESGRPLRLLYVSRISVRKGVEQIVELSHRLKDLQGKVELHVIGGATMWSDYRKHLNDLNPQIGRYLGGMAHDRIMQAYDEADALLLPSHYEPGGIVVGEALSRGVPVVVSSEIGTAEPVQGPCCRRFPAGNMDAFEREVRTLLDDMWRDPAPCRESAHQQARAHFAPDKIAAKFISILTEVANQRKSAATKEDKIITDRLVASHS